MLTLKFCKSWWKQSSRTYQTTTAESRLDWGKKHLSCSVGCRVWCPTMPKSGSSTPSWAAVVPRQTLPSPSRKSCSFCREPNGVPRRLPNGARKVAPASKPLKSCSALLTVKDIKFLLYVVALILFKFQRALNWVKNSRRLQKKWKSLPHPDWPWNPCRPKLR